MVALLLIIDIYPLPPSLQYVPHPQDVTILMINSQLNLTWWNVVNIDKKIKDGARSNILVDNY